MDAYHIQKFNDGSTYTDVPGLCKTREVEVYVYLASEVDARIAELEKALQTCVDAMNMQISREIGEMHITQPTAQKIWKDALALADAALKL